MQYWRVIKSSKYLYSYIELYHILLCTLACSFMLHYPVLASKSCFNSRIFPPNFVLTVEEWQQVLHIIIHSEAQNSLVSLHCQQFHGLLRSAASLFCNKWNLSFSLWKKKLSLGWKTRHFKYNIDKVFRMSSNMCSSNVNLLNTDVL